MLRRELLCTRCNAHQGHVFAEGVNGGIILTIAEMIAVSALVARCALTARLKGSPSRRAPAGIARFVLAAEPALSGRLVDDGLLVELAVRHVEDALAAGVDVALYDAVGIGRLAPHRPVETDTVPPVPGIDELTPPEGMAIIDVVQKYFAGRPHDFEKSAGAIARLMLPDIAELDVTRPSRDGGRDAVGTLRLGRGSGSILVDFALEAKCYGLGNSVGVREMSRLISRLRHRQFGVLVTTSHVDIQAYREIKEDQHPIIVIAAADIVELLRANGHADIGAVRRWLEREFAPLSLQERP